MNHEGSNNKNKACRLEQEPCFCYDFVLTGLRFDMFRRSEPIKTRA